MAGQRLAAGFLQVPAVTRAYTAACVLTTAAVVSGPGGRVGTMVTVPDGQEWLRDVACFPGLTLPPVPQQLELLSPFQLYFNPHLVFRKFQVRRP